MNLSGLSIIGGRRGEPGGPTFSAVNPATGERLPGVFHGAGPADVEAAGRSADEAFAVYGQWSGRERLALLERIALSLEATAEAIIERAQLETALPAARLKGELARTCFQLRLYGQAAAEGLCAGARMDRADAGRTPQPKPELRSMLVPLGPVAVFGAGNFPLAYSVAGGDTASALAAGCPVIVKAHPAHPGTSELVGESVRQAARAAAAPPGVFSLLFDAGFEIGRALVKHPLVKAVGFTGSRAAGRTLMDLAAARPEPIPVFAEMSSINPVFILAGALAQRAEEIATGLHASVTLGVGQFCTNPGLVFVEGEGAGKKFLDKLEQLMAGTPAGTMLTAGICANYHAGVERLSNTPGVKRAAGSGGRDDPGKTQAGAALFVTGAPAFLSNHDLMKEVFGPSTLVVECATRAEMTAAAKTLEGQLTATIQAAAEELGGARELAALLATKAGRVVYNGFPTGVEVTHAMTHGGPYPATSDGRSTSVGTRALERFLRPVSYQNFPDALLPAELQDRNPLGIPRLQDGRF